MPCAFIDLHLQLLLRLVSFKWKSLCYLLLNDCLGMVYYISQCHLYKLCGNWVPGTQFKMTAPREKQNLGWGHFLWPRTVLAGRLGYEPAEKMSVFFLAGDLGSVAQSPPQSIPGTMWIYLLYVIISSPTETASRRCWLISTTPAGISAATGTHRLSGRLNNGSPKMSTS